MALPSDPQPPDFTIVRAIGAVIGAFLSLTFLRPQNVRDLLARGTFSIVSGYVFGFVLLEYMGWPEAPRYWMAATVAVGGSSWLIAGAAVAAIRTGKLPWSK